MRNSLTFALLVTGSASLTKADLPSIIKVLLANGFFPSVRFEDAMRRVESDRGIHVLVETNYRDDFPANYHMEWILGMSVTRMDDSEVLSMDIKQPEGLPVEIVAYFELDLHDGSLSMEADIRLSHIVSLVRDLAIRLGAARALIDAEDFIEEAREHPGALAVAWFTLLRPGAANEVSSDVFRDAPACHVRDVGQDVVELQMATSIVSSDRKAVASYRSRMKEHFGQSARQTLIGGPVALR